MKQCTICKTVKSTEDFNKKATTADGLQNVCRPCNRDRSRKYYLDNREYHRRVVREKSKGYRERNRLFLVDALSGGCVDCGNLDIRVLEFDHVSGEKLEGVARLASAGHSLEKVKAEIAKCEVRCKNCHAIKTFERLGGSWHDKFLAPLT